MVDKIAIVICAIICIGGAAWGWWFENGPEKKKDGKSEIVNDKGEH